MSNKSESIKVIRKAILVLLLSTLIFFYFIAAPAYVKVDDTNTFRNTKQFTSVDDDTSIDGVEVALNQYNGAEIKSAAENVVLSDTVWALQEKENAERLAQNIPGIDLAQNDPQAKKMGPAAKAGEYIDDSAITTLVKGRLLSQKGLDSLDISVETNNGVVTLSGEVDNEAQIGLAENVVKETKGVQEVDNKLVVKKAASQ